mmetsp:Transcript_13331/g.49500  ORF Transcript_13331/g.49500 Transcript_13331/m.49500 type:complete len:211 (-) Transcript_13331:2962-3594(-)
MRHCRLCSASGSLLALHRTAVARPRFDHRGGHHNRCLGGQRSAGQLPLGPSDLAGARGLQLQLHRKRGQQLLGVGNISRALVLPERAATGADVQLPHKLAWRTNCAEITTLRWCRADQRDALQSATAQGASLHFSSDSAPELGRCSNVRQSAERLAIEEWRTDAQDICASFPVGRTSGKRAPYRGLFLGFHSQLPWWTSPGLPSQAQHPQ